MATTIGPDGDEGRPASREMLVFALGTTGFVVEAHFVDTGIGWREPVLVPRAGTPLRGVIQDRGRIVAVLAHPTGGSGSASAAQPLRIVVCRTPHGFVGLPATSARTVCEVELRGPVSAGGVVDTSAGLLTLIDPEELARRLVADAGPRSALRPDGL